MIRNATGRILIVSFSEMYDNSIYYLHSTKSSDIIVSSKDNIVLPPVLDNTSDTGDTSIKDILVIGSYFAIFAMIATILPLSYFLTLKVYNYVY